MRLDVGRASGTRRGYRQGCGVVKALTRTSLFRIHLYSSTRVIQTTYIQCTLSVHILPSGGPIWIHGLYFIGIFCVGQGFPIHWFSSNLTHKRQLLPADATRRVSYSKMNTLYLQNHSARRVGLSRTKAPSGGCQPKGNQPENQPKENQPKGKYDSPTPPVSPPPVPFKMHTMEEPKPNKVEDDVTAQPAPDSSDDEAYEKRQNIQPSQNIGKKEKAEKKNGLRGGKAKGPTINGKIKPEKHLKEKIPSQEDSPHSPKRKSQDELEGGAFAKKKRVKTQAKYSSQSSQGKSIGKHAKNAKSSSIKGSWPLQNALPNTNRLITITQEMLRGRLLGGSNQWKLCQTLRALKRQEQRN
jgi:hypothetical protein